MELPGLVSLGDVEAAAERISPVARVTPLIALEPRVSLKAECLQLTGSFKLRGAYHALDRRPLARVVCHSSGNHAQGVARAARLLGVEAVAVMPQDAPAIKRERVLRDGAEVIEVGNSSDERVRVARALTAARGLVLLSSTEHPQVIAGQGTVGLELVASCLALPELGASLRATEGHGLEVLVPVGGGGLASGVALAVKALLPRATVVGVEPALAADARESLSGGRVVRWPVEQLTRTMADGLRHTSVGPLAFAHLQRYVDRIVTVSDAEIEHAMRTLAGEAHLGAEPSGAVSVAAHLAGVTRGSRREHTVCVVSGGNVGLRAFATVVGACGPADRVAA